MLSIVDILNKVSKEKEHVEKRESLFGDFGSTEFTYDPSSYDERQYDESTTRKTFSLYRPI